MLYVVAVKLRDATLKLLSGGFSLAWEWASNLDYAKMHWVYGSGLVTLKIHRSTVWIQFHL
jgi:hypothetical protein